MIQHTNFVTSSMGQGRFLSPRNKNCHRCEEIIRKEKETDKQKDRPSDKSYKHRQGN